MISPQSMDYANLLFLEWKTSIVDTLKNKITALKTKVRPVKTSLGLKSREVSSALETLQSNFVIVPIDKASNNVAFICKRYYAKVLLKEFGLLDGTTTTTYSLINEDQTEILDFHKRHLKQHFKIEVNSNMMKLPSAYWMPKMHKTPVGARFIIASKKCSIKDISKNISSVFKLFFRQLQNYWDKTFKYTLMQNQRVLNTSKLLFKSC